MAMTFAEALKEQLIKRGKIKGRFGKLIKLIDSKPSRMRTRILERIENHVRLYLKEEGYASIAETKDWSTVSAVNWEKVFDIIIKILTALLPLLLMFI